MNRNVGGAVSAPECPHGLMEYAALDGGWWQCPGYGKTADWCPVRPAASRAQAEAVPEKVRAAAAVPPVPEQRQAVEVAREPVGRLRWLDEMVRQVGEKALPASYVYLGHVFTMGHFLFDTGEGTRHQSQGYLAQRAGVSEATAKRFLRVCRSLGLLEPMKGRGLRLRGDSGVSDETPLYRLTAPVRGEGVIGDPCKPC